VKYECSCGATNCKLWRLYQTFMDSQELFCANCALANQDKVGPVNAGGYLQGRYGMTDQIGWLVPAVPDNLQNLDNIQTFWGYTSVPQDGVDWWRGLPSYPENSCSSSSSPAPTDAS
jgi:hypothetical protein